MNIKLKPYAPILVIDDEEAILLSIDTILNMAGLNNVITCADSRQAMAIANQRTPSVILLDLNMPHVNGETLIAQMAEQFPRVPIVIITGRIDAETAVECMKSGAADYIVKPVEEDRLLSAVHKALKTNTVSDREGETGEESLLEKLQHPKTFSTIITESPRMIEIFEYIESVALTDQPILVGGETGTGKELIARAIHSASGRKGDFIAVNVAGLDDNVFSDTLFGHVKGAFTGADVARKGLLERADSGTLFLDEIGDLTQYSQVKLLRLLQEGEYLPLGSDIVLQSNARIIASTHVDLWELQRQGHFRKDLHYRLRTHRVVAPPLRERKEDIPALIDHFINQAARALKKKRPKLPLELNTLLENYDFPGNIRELQAMIFDAMAQHKSGPLSLIVFREHMARMRNLTNHDHPHLSPSFSFDQASSLPSIKKATQLLIEEAMRRADNNQSIAAALLGISQQALSKRLKNIAQQQNEEKK